MFKTHVLTGPPASGKSTRAKEICGDQISLITNTLAPVTRVEVLVLEEIPDEINLISAYHWIRGHQYQFPNLKTLVLVTQAQISDAWDKADGIQIERM